MTDKARLVNFEKPFAADEINDVNHLKVKLEYGDSDSAIQVSESNPLPVNMVEGGSITITNANLDLGLSTDAFGRLRASEPFTLFESAFRYRDNTFKWNHAITNNSGLVDVQHSANEGSMLLTVGTSNGDSVIRETKRVFSYQPGKSLLIFNTFLFAEPKANLRQRVGYFGASDGVYFMTEGTTKYMVIRKSTSGSVNDTDEKIAQSSWNTDTLDGSGGLNNPSGRTLDLNRPQILFIDIEWLGVGTVRVGFVINGEFVTVHKFHHANTSPFTGVYMKTATLPIRYEITNTGITGSSSTMKQICSTVISEGGYLNQSLSFTARNVLSGKNTSDTAYTPLISIQLKNTNLDAVVVPSFFEAFGLENSPYSWAIFLNPTLTNASFNSIASYSNVEIDTAATALSGGVKLNEGLFAGGNKGSGNIIGMADIPFQLQLGRTLTGVSDILCLAAQATSNNNKSIGVLGWQEHN